MAKKNKIKVSDLFNGNFLTSNLIIKNLLLIMVFVVIFIFYRSIRYKTESTIKEINDITETIKKLNNKASEQRSTWQKTTLMIEASQKLEPVGVKIPTEPIKKRIILKEHKDE
ncbi:MAG: hypothetical protein LBR17_08835 [Bacteroidales bacterium]|jgi:amino acid permease|nr:hypothetical protein [Bacteroidales bacterium]